VVGVVVATSGGSTHHGPTQAQLQAQRQEAQRRTDARRKAQAATAATAAANKRLETILAGLARTRNQTVTRLLNEKTQATQIRDAASVQKAYSTTSHKVAALRAKTPLAAPIARQLTKLAGDYGRLVTAGHANKPSVWNRIYKTVDADEKTLQGLVGKV
jgi:hypothetical protein